MTVPITDRNRSSLGMTVTYKQQPWESMTTAAKWLLFEILQLPKCKKCCHRSWMNKVWCKWQVANFSCPLSNTKERGKKLIPVHYEWWPVKLVTNTRNWTVWGFPTEIRIIFYQSKYYRSYYLTATKTAIQEDIKTLTFDVHELHISQCWLSELTYRWHIEQNLGKKL